MLCILTGCAANQVELLNKTTSVTCTLLPSQQPSQSSTATVLMSTHKRCAHVQLVRCTLGSAVTNAYPAACWFGKHYEPRLSIGRLEHYLTAHICSQVRMVDCVIAADGYSYERAAITSWIQDSIESPVTSEALTHNSLQPNITLKSVICMHSDD